MNDFESRITKIMMDYLNRTKSKSDFKTCLCLFFIQDLLFVFVPAGEVVFVMFTSSLLLLSLLSQF